MDHGRTYANSIALDVALVVGSLLVAIGSTLNGLRIEDQRSAMVIVTATVTGFGGGSPTLTFKDESGTTRSVTLNRLTAKGERVGDRVELGYPRGQWLRATDTPDSWPWFLGAVGLLLVGPALFVHDLRVRRRLAIARAPTNPVAVDVEVRTVKSGRSATRFAMVSFPGSVHGLPDCKLVITPTARSLRDGRYPGQIAGDLRFGGTAVLWIAGVAVRVGNIRRV